MKKLLLLITIMISTLPQFCLAQDCSVSIDGPSTIFCPDESITLTAQTQGFDDANTTFLWFANDYPGNQIADTGTDTTLNVQPPYTQTTTTFWVSASGTCQGSSYTTTDSLTVTVFSNFQLTGVAPAQAAICAGETISITATAIPNTNLTYTWAGPNGFALTNQTNATLTRNNATPNMSGTYTVTVTGQGGCFQTASTTITVYPQPAVNATAADTTVCPTQQNLQLQATGSGGTEPYIFEWSGPNGFNNNTQNPAINNMPDNAAGNYTVTLTDDNDCTATGAVNITANPLPTLSASAADNTVCPTQQNLQLQATGSGGTEPYIFEWSGPNGFNNNTQNPAINNMPDNAAGNYTVTLIDDNDCTATDAVNITANPLPTLSASAADNTVCPTQQNLQLQASGIGGANPYVFAWSGPNSFINNTQNPVINNMPANAAGNYTVTLTDDNDCTATGSFLVTANSLPTANITVTETSGIANNDGTVCAGASAALTATGAGTGGAYSWSNGLATAAITVNPTANTTYTVTVTNAQGCTANTGTTITATPLPSITFNTPMPNTACTAPFTGAVTASATNGSSFTYAWNTTPVNTNAALTNVNGNSYTVTVTNNNGCSNSDTVTIDNNTGAPPITATSVNPTTCGGNGTITLSGLVSGVVYLVTYTKNGSPQSEQNYTALSGQITIPSLSAGIYANIIATNNSSGCPSSVASVITLTDPPQPTINLPNTTINICTGVSSFSIPYTATNNDPNQYSLTSGTQALPGFDNLTNIPLSGTPVLIALPSSPIPVAGTYTFNLTVRNSNTNCVSGAIAITLVINNTPTPTITGANTVCTTQSITLTGNPTGGTWQSSNPAAATVNASSGQVIGVTAGNVTITYTISQNGCSASATKTITVETCGTPCPNPPTVNINPPGATICGLQNQALNITLGGSATTATLTETGFGSLSAATVSAPGSVVVTYNPAANDLGNSVTVTATTNDPDGPGPCTAASFTATLQYVNLPNANFTGIADNEVCLGTPETLTPTVPGGNWSSNDNGVATVAAGVVTAVAIGTATITYTITNATTGCQNSTTKVITVSDCACPNPAVVNVNPTNTLVCGTAPQTFTVTLSGGAFSATIAAQNGAGNLSPTLLNGSGTFTYTPNATDAGNTINFTIITNDPDGTGNTCSAASATASLQVNANPVVTDITATNNPICVGQTSTLSSSPIGGVWSSSNSGVATVNSSSGLVTGIAAGSATVTYTVSNASGCTASKSIDITVNALPTVNAITGNTNICVGSTTQLNNSTPGGVWSSSNESIATVSGGLVTGIAQGQATITYTVTNTTTGCQNSSNTVVTVFALPTASISGTTTICSGGSTNINFTGTPNATVTYNIGGGSNQTITLNAFGTATVNTGALTAGTAYNLVSVTSSGSTPCTQALLSGSAGITIVSLPTAGITASALAVCWGSSDTIIFTGTANATVTYNISGGSNQSIALDPSGMASLSTGNLTATATYNLVSVALTGGSVPCSAPLSGSVTVAVNQLPNANAGADQTICAGSSVTLTASGAGSGGIYEWSNGSLGSSITVSPSDTTTYTVTATDSNGCEDEGEVEVVIKPLPQANIINPPDPICEGESTTIEFSGTPGDTLIYNINGGANINSIVPFGGIFQLSTGTLIDSTTYTLVGVTSSDLPACSNTINSPVTVVVHPLPDATISADTTSTSTTGLITLSAPPANSSYIWSNDNSITQTIPINLFYYQSDIVAATYTVTVTNANNCSASGSYDIADIIGQGCPTPKIYKRPNNTPGVAPDVYVCTLDTVKYPNIEYYWGIVDITTSNFSRIETNNGYLAEDLIDDQVFVAPYDVIIDTTKETYAVITHTGNCWRMAVFTGKQEEAPINTSGLQVQPNPTHGSFDLRFSDSYRGLLQVSIADMAGRLLYRQNFNKTETLFTQNLSLPLPLGVYLLHVVYGREQRVVKIMVY